MKKYLLPLIGCFYFLFLACDGGFEPANFAINLEYPEVGSKCEKGTPDGNLLKLPFQWIPQGDITNFSLVLNDEVITAEPKQLENNILEFEFSVDYSETYNWKIVSGDVESEVRTFTTPSAEENNNTAPNPVIFDEEEYSSSGVTISWTGGDDDVNDIIRYDLYWHISSDISSEVYTDRQLDLQNTTATLDIPNFDSNTEYFILVIAKDDKGNQSFSTTKICQFCSG